MPPRSGLVVSSLREQQQLPSRPAQQTQYQVEWDPTWVPATAVDDASDVYFGPSESYHGRILQTRKNQADQREHKMAWTERIWMDGGELPGAGYLAEWVEAKAAAKAPPKKGVAARTGVPMKTSIATKGSRSSDHISQGKRKLDDDEGEDKSVKKCKHIAAVAKTEEAEMTSGGVGAVEKAGKGSVNGAAIKLVNGVAVYAANGAVNDIVNNTGGSVAQDAVKDAVKDASESNVKEAGEDAVKDVVKNAVDIMTGKVDE